MAKKLTTRFVRSLKTKDVHGLRVYDSALPGLSVRVGVGGTRVFEIRYKSPSGRRKWFKVGAFGTFTVAQARERAKKLLRLAEDGEDLVLEAQRAREKPTFENWARTYTERAKERGKRSIRNDYIYLGIKRATRGPRKGERLFPEMAEWAKRTLDEIQRADVQVLFERIGQKRGRITANRWLAAVRSCFVEAERDKWIAENPAWKIRQNRENPARDRTLSASEREALVAAIQGEKDRHARVGLLLLLSTGARLGEVLKMRWPDLDLNEMVWKLPDSKNGRGRALPLLEAVAEDLRTLPKTSLFVVAGRWPGKPRANLIGPWKRVISAAAKGVPTILSLHVHDLRRSAGLEIYRSAGLHAASVLLGHKNITTTARIYVPLGSEDLRGPVEQYGKLINFTQKG